MKLRLIFIIVILGLATLFGHARMWSITYTTIGTNDLSITVETNTRYLIHSVAVAFTNLATGTVTLVHTREGHTVTIVSETISNDFSFIRYIPSPYLVDGKQGDALALSTTNVGKPSKAFLTIQY